MECPAALKKKPMVISCMCFFSRHTGHICRVYTKTARYFWSAFSALTKTLTKHWNRKWMVYFWSLVMVSVYCTAKLILQCNKESKLLFFFLSLSLSRTLDSFLSFGFPDYFSRVVFLRFWCKCCPWWLDVLCAENTNGTTGVFPGTERGVEVECWLYNNHYSAEMAIRRGLSVLGPDTLWLDFPCVAILLCPWMFLCHCSPVSLCILLKQLYRFSTSHRTQGINQDAVKIVLDLSF